MSTRRQLVRSATMLAVCTLFGGCDTLLRRAAETCPEDPADSGGVDWWPSPAAPVFYGHRDLDETTGAPRPLRIWYPSVDGSPPGAPLLKLCLIRWPLVLFLHGDPPLDCPSTATYYRRWALLPSILARSGFVVIAPQFNARPAEVSGADPSREEAIEVLDWARNDWADAAWLDSNPQATAVVGHSRGAGTGLRVMAARPEIGAFASLGGILRRTDYEHLSAPSFFMWIPGGVILEDPSWDRAPTPKYEAVIDEGEHFDYVTDLPQCNETRGPCTVIEGVAGDLVSLFLMRYLRSAVYPVSIGLAPRYVSLTPNQALFGGGRLAFLASVESRNGCGITLRWDDGAARGSRRIGS